MAAERGDSVTKLQKVCCVILSLCFFGLLVLMPGDFFLDGNVYRQLPLYCFLEEEASGVSMRDDPETYARLARSNAEYLETMVEQENQAELGEKAKNGKEMEDRHSREGESAEDIFGDSQKVQSGTAMMPSAASEPMATTSPAVSPVPAEGEQQEKSSAASVKEAAPAETTESPETAGKVTSSIEPTRPPVSDEDAISTEDTTLSVIPTATPEPAKELMPSVAPVDSTVPAEKSTSSAAPSDPTESARESTPSTEPMASTAPAKDSTSPAVLTDSPAPVEDAESSAALPTTPVSAEDAESSAALTATPVPAEDAESSAALTAMPVPVEDAESSASLTATPVPVEDTAPSAEPVEPTAPAGEITSSTAPVEKTIPSTAPSGVPTATPEQIEDSIASVALTATSEQIEDATASVAPTVTPEQAEDTTPSAAPTTTPAPAEDPVLSVVPAVTPVSTEDSEISAAPNTTPVPTEDTEISVAPTATSVPGEDATSPAVPAATSAPDEATSSPSSPTATPAAQSASAGIGAQPRVDLAPERLADFDYLLGNFFIVDPDTAANQELLSAARFLDNDLTIKKDPSVPQILLYHSHSQETFADSREGETEDTIVGVGNYLEKLLTETYGYRVIHVTEAFDLAGGELDRSKAYDYARPYIENILKENPSVEVVIDLHRDGVPEDRRLVTTVNGKPTAQLMFYNGLSYTRSGGNVSYLPNPYIQDNLAFSFQMEYQAAQYYPDLYRGIYLAGLRYNLHLRKRSVLLEAGAQTNTVQEVKNAVEPFADLLNRMLTGEKKE